MSMHKAHRQSVDKMHAMIRGCGPDDHAERERLLWSLVVVHAGALTPVSEDEKRGMERVLAILERKIAEGGGAPDQDHNRFYAGRWSAWKECAFMLRSAMQPESVGVAPSVVEDGGNSISGSSPRID